MRPWIADTSQGVDEKRTMVSMPAIRCELDEIVDHTIGRALDLFGLDVPTLPRWPGTGR